MWYGQQIGDPTHLGVLSASVGKMVDQSTLGVNYVKEAILVSQ